MSKKKGFLYILLIAFLFILIFFHPALAQEESEPQDQEKPPEQPSVITPSQPQQQPPSGEETRIAKHWSKYKYPETFPTGSKVHIIIKGDTLWDLAEKYLNNGFVWPKIWEHNNYIKNSHWIYPGDPLVIPGVQPVSPAEIAKTEEEAAKAAAGERELYEFTKEDLAGIEAGKETEVIGGAYEEEFLEDITQIKPIAKYYDLHCYDTVLPDENMFDAKIISSEKTVLNLKIFDYVYIDLGIEQNVKAGDIFSVLHRDTFRPVYHPEDESFIGWPYQNEGKIKVVMAFDNFSIARVIENCDSIQVGDQIRPLVKIPIPLLEEEKDLEYYEKETAKSQGYIIYGQIGHHQLAKDKLGVINLGKTDNLRLGDLLTIYRENVVVGLPRIVLGKAVVLIVEESTAVIKVLQNRFEIEVGDMVEVR